MSKATQIYEEAKAAADKAAALTPYITGGQGDKLRIEDQELWLNLFTLRTTYETLSKLLTKRAGFEEANEKAKSNAPHVVHPKL